MDCGNTWDTLYDKFGDQLETVSPQQNPWQPVCGDWEKVSIDLTPYATEKVMLKFTGVNGWGNNFYLDNVHLDDTVSCPIPVSLFSWVDTGTTVYFSDLSAGATDWYWDLGDGTNSTDPNPVHTYASAGTFTVCQITSNSCGEDTICNQLTISLPIGKDGLIPNHDIRVSPNPFDHSTLIVFDNADQEEYALSIYDLLGHKVKVHNGIQTSSFTLFKDDLPAGIYCIVLRGSKRSYWDKIVIE